MKKGTDLVLGNHILTEELNLTEEGTMTAVNLSRVTMGAVIMTGLFFYEPVAYVASAAMILSGLTGT